MVAHSEDADRLRRHLNDNIDNLREVLSASGWWHSIDLGGGRITSGVHTLDELRDNYARFNLPEDLTGKRVLDVGCWDGFYSFEAERHGAEVVAVDCWRPETFFAARRALGSRVEFQELSVYELSREQLGSFDIVLFLGVLYHLPYPLLALRRICEMTQDVALIESHVIDHLLETPLPVMEFYELDELGGQYDCWWGPNRECLVRMTRAAGFARAEVLRHEAARAVIKGYRRWEEKFLRVSPSLQIRDVVNAIFLDRRLMRRGRFALLSVWVDGLPAEATRKAVRVEVGGFGSNPVYLTHPGSWREDAGQTRINRLTPPGLVVSPAIREMALASTQIITPVPPGLEAQEVALRVIYEGDCSQEFVISLTESSEW